MAGITTLLQGLMRHPQFDEIDFSQALRGIIARRSGAGERGGGRVGKHAPVRRAFEGYGLSETTCGIGL